MPPKASLNVGRGSPQEVVARALLFVSAASNSVSVRSALAPMGYSPDVHGLFWRCIHQVCRFREGHDVAAAVRDANQQLGKRLTPVLRLGRAATKNAYPAQHAYVFEGLEGGTGAAGLVCMQTLLDRLDDLESGAERKATRKADAAALEKMAERGITPAERQRLRGLLNIAQCAMDSTDPTAEPPPPEAMETLRSLIEEWSEVARVVVTRRADLILLGLARRRKSGSKKDGVILGPPVQVGPMTAVSQGAGQTATPASTPRGLLAPSVPPPPPVPTIGSLSGGVPG